MVNVDTYAIPMDHYGQTYRPIGIFLRNFHEFSFSRFCSKKHPGFPHEFEAVDHQGESHLLGMSLGTRIFRKDVFLLFMCLMCYPCLGCVCFCMPKFYSGRLTKKTPASHHFFGAHCGSKQNQNLRTDPLWRTSGVVILVKCFWVFQLDLWMKTDLFFLGVNFDRHHFMGKKIFQHIWDLGPHLGWTANTWRLGCDPSLASHSQ